MKKFLPYILITAFIGTFLMLSFVLPFSGTVVGPKVAEAQTFENQDKKESVSSDKSRIDNVFMSKYVENSYEEASNGNPFSKNDGPKLPNGGTSWGAKFIDISLGYGLSVIASLAYYISGYIFNASAHFMEFIIKYSVTDFKANTDRIGIIDVGYKIILNLANMVFIFILLFISIKTILGEGGDIKKLLTNVIIVALFINFSLFMTRVIIDASNILSLEFLNAIKTESSVVMVKENDQMVPKTKYTRGSIATAFMSGLRLQTEAYNPNAKIIKDDSHRGFEYFNMTIQFLGGTAVNLVAAFVFFAVAFLFLTRFIALLFYMLFSPAAFIGLVSDELKQYSSQWWKGLQSQAIFAPVFLMIAYLVSAIIKSGALWKTLGGDDYSTFFTAIGSGFTQGFAVVMNYVILIALIIGGLIISKKMASEGSAGMVGYADKFRGWMQGAVGRNTLGRAAYLANRSETFNKLASISPTVGAFFKKQANKVSGASFGGAKGGYSKALKEGIKQKKEIADSVLKSQTKKEEKQTRIEQNELDKRMVSQLDLQNKKLESERKEMDLKEKYQLYSNLLEEVKKLEGKYDELSDKAAQTRDPKDINDATSASVKLNDGQRRLVNERVRLAAQGVNLNRYEAELENAKIDITRDDANLEDNIRDTGKIKNKLDNLIAQRKNVREKMKRRYAKNLPFATFGESLWGDKLAFLDKIFPSYTEASDELRKGKTEDEKAIMKMVDKIAEEKAKTMTGGGSTP